MLTRTLKSRDKLLIAYDREMLRSAFVSLFWSIISRKNQYGGFSLKILADKIGVHKSAPSRWFSGGHPNWTINTISDIANALDLDIEIRGHDRKTGETYAPYGLVEPTRTSTIHLSKKFMESASDSPLASNISPRDIADKPNARIELVDA
jgi:hypothetical protein